MLLDCFACSSCTTAPILTSLLALAGFFSHHAGSPSCRRNHPTKHQSKLSTPGAGLQCHKRKRHATRASGTENAELHASSLQPSTCKLGGVVCVEEKTLWQRGCCGSEGGLRVSLTHARRAGSDEYQEAETQGQGEDVEEGVVSCRHDHCNRLSQRRNLAWSACFASRQSQHQLCMPSILRNRHVLERVTSQWEEL